MLWWLHCSLIRDAKLIASGIIPCLPKTPFVIPILFCSGCPVRRELDSAEWASKAGWNKGGAHKADVDPKPPKQAFTPLYAFLASQQLKLKLLNPSLGTADLQARAQFVTLQKFID